MRQEPRYEHTQVGYAHWILGAIALVALGAGLAAGGEAAWALLPLALLFGSFALAFRQLTVRDEGAALSLRYGPLPLFSKSIPYAEMTAVEPTRSDLLDGGGIHWVPGRGWIYNLWGFDCVRIRLGDRALRVGTDDLDGLLAFLERQVEERRGAAGGAPAAPAPQARA